MGVQYHIVLRYISGNRDMPPLWRESGHGATGAGRVLSPTGHENAAEIEGREREGAEFLARKSRSGGRESRRRRRSRRGDFVASRKPACHQSRLCRIETGFFGAEGNFQGSGRGGRLERSCREYPEM